MYWIKDRFLSVGPSMRVSDFSQILTSHFALWQHQTPPSSSDTLSSHASSLYSCYILSEEQPPLPFFFFLWKHPSLSKCLHDSASWTMPPSLESLLGLFYVSFQTWHSCNPYYVEFEFCLPVYLLPSEPFVTHLYFSWHEHCWMAQRFSMSFLIPFFQVLPKTPLP